jgi:hypothetical protein
METILIFDLYFLFIYMAALLGGWIELALFYFEKRGYLFLGIMVGLVVALLLPVIILFCSLKRGRVVLSPDSSLRF